MYCTCNPRANILETFVVQTTSMFYHKPFKASVHIFHFGSLVLCNMPLLQVLTVSSFTPQQAQEVLDIAKDLKANPKKYASCMDRKTLLMLFEKPSLRTRCDLYDMPREKSDTCRGTLVDTC